MTDEKSMYEIGLQVGNITSSIQLMNQQMQQFAQQMQQLNRTLDLLQNRVEGLEGGKKK